MRNSSWPLAAALLAFASASPADQAAEPWRAEARGTLAKIIAFRTTEAAVQVPAMAHWLAQKFVAGGFPAADVRVLPMADSAALVVRYRGDGGARPVLVLAHMDVVEAKREDWQRDPFTLTEENGYFYGRGTADVKGDIALVTTTFLRLKKENFRPNRDLVLVLTGDEETAQATTRALTTAHRQELDAEFALNADGGGGWLDDGNGKPTIYYIQGAEKAYASYEFTVRNPGGHSSRPRADNAIYTLADVIVRLRAHQFPVMWNDWTLGNFRAEAAVTPPPLGPAMAKFAADPGESQAARILSQYPETVGKVRTTCVATLLAGGHADNALPQSAAVTFNCRLFPGMRAAEVEQALKQVAGDGVEVRRTSGPVVESDASPMRSDVVAAVTRAVHATYPGLQLVPEMAAYTTDGSYFRGAGIPTYGVGAVYLRPKDDFSHGLDERLQTDVFYQGLTHWYVLLKEVARITR